MKRILSLLLSVALIMGCITVGVSAEATSTAYTINATTKTISGVAPLTTVSTFKANITGATVEVINVDGSVMEDTAYATENVFAKIDGELYKITTKALYQPLKDLGTTHADGTTFYNMTANNLSEYVIGNANYKVDSGFNRIGKFGKFGTGNTTEGTAPPANTEDQRVKASKGTYAGNTVYKLENDSNQYAYLRSHAGYKTSNESGLRKLTESSGYVVTSYSFKADKLGNISVFHTMPNSTTSGSLESYDSPMSKFLGYANAKYTGNALHFLEDGKIMVGGNYESDIVNNRKPAYEVGEWTAGTEYNVSIVQKSNIQGGTHYISGIYINGTKVFPQTNHTSGTNGIGYDADTTYYKMYTNKVKYYKGISSVYFATAPETPGEKLTVDLTDFKVYGIAKAADFNANITKKNIALDNAENITVTENDTNNMPAITDSVAETVAQFKAKYSDVIMGVYNADGTFADDDEYLASTMSVKIASADGLQGKTYKVNATKYVVPYPDTTVYTVDTTAKTVSGVAPFTTVAAFLANFTNGANMSVVNIDGSVMEGTAYATENVSLKAPNGETYAINVNYPNAYAPIANSTLQDGEVLYDLEADKADGHELEGIGGFSTVQVFEKFAYGDGTPGPQNTESQKVVATKETINGKPVYVIDNDSERYAYIRSHESTTEQPVTDLHTLTDNKKVVTTVEFTADKLGNISVFHNTPIRNGSQRVTKYDSGIDGIIPSDNLPYAPNSVHFLEDGSVKIGGLYSNYSQAKRAPAQTTNFQWQPGVKYSVSMVHRYVWGGTDAYIEGVYINGEKIFPNSSSLEYGCIKRDGEAFKIVSRDSNTFRHGGGVSSVMIGTAPKDANDNLKVYLSDVKVYGIENTNKFAPASDIDITIASTNPTITVDNERGVITAMGPVALSDFETTAKLKLENGYLKAVSADGLVAKTYAIETVSITSGFYNGANDAEIKALSQATGNNIYFKADLDETTLADGTTPAVIFAVYDSEGNYKDCVIATGVKLQGEVTRYKAIFSDISEYRDDEDPVLKFGGFIWDDMRTISPLRAKAELR